MPDAGVPFVVAVRANAHDVAVVIPEPIPNDHLFTFDAADAPEAGRFAVRAADRLARPVRPFADVPAIGGSHGDICLVLREDAAFAPDAQTDEAAALARRLNAEGLTVECVTNAADERIARADLVHIFGAVSSASTEAAIAAARAAGRPYVVSLEPLAAPDTGYAEDGLLTMLQLGNDSAAQEIFRDAYFRNALQIDGIPATLPAGEVQRRDRRFGAACAGATAVLLAPHDDVDAFCRRFGEIAPERVRCGGVLLAAEPPEEPVAASVPSGSFVLMHAPLVRRSNLHLAVTALAAAPYGIVVAGPVSDVDLAISLRRNAGRDVVFLPDPTDGVVAALYRRAAVFLEPSCRPAGVSRIVRAALCGALPLVPRSSPLAPLLDESAHLDTSTFARLASGAGAAIGRTDLAVAAALAAARFSALADQRTAFAAVLDAYAQAQAPA
ncbi:MAG: hypothetical protein ABR591_11710 [Candidatus Velthaea sp.]